jgi:hypothetical protein
MLLYHSGLDVIKEPDIAYGRKNADFGQGFYMTPDKEFAYKWSKARGTQMPIVNFYELDTDGLKVKEFFRSEEWFQYIYGNRNGKQDQLEADVVIGPIANDTLYNTLGITTSGFLEKEEAMELFMIGPEYIQVVIKTEAAKANLKWLSSEELTREQISEFQKKVQSEELEFQKIFAETLERIH